MTCAIGLKYNNIIYIGADNVGSNEHIKLSRNDQKVFIKNNMIFGCTTSYRMINLLQYQLEIPIHNNKSIDAYMYTDFIETVRTLFKDKGFSKIDANVQTGGNFIVGYQGNLYEIENDFQIVKHNDNFCCVGSGSYYAYGAMKILQKEKISPENKIKRALEVAEYYNPFVRKPFKILYI